MSENLTRRGFLQQSGMSAAGAAGLASLLSTTPARAAASERVRVGLIGCGGMGTVDLVHQIDAGAECAALADPDDHQSAATLEKVMAKGQKPAVYRDFRKVLDHKDIDAVIVATPDHWHAICAILACQAGKDVYVQKPVSHNIREGRAMVRAAREYNRVMQVGTQQRSGDHFISAKALVESGKLGKICLCRAWRVIHHKNLGYPADEPPPAYVDYDLWLGPAPKRPFNRNRFHYQWRYYWDYAGGQQADWGIHLMDIVQWYMNVDAPLAVASTGGKWILKSNTETPDTQVTIFDYPGFNCVYEHRQANSQAIEGLDHGMAFYGENGTLTISRKGWQVFSEGERIPDPPKSEGSELLTPHAKQFLRCIKTRETPNTDIEIGHRSTTACQLANIAFHVGRKIRWDAKKEEVIGDREANALLGREYRKPWELPTV